MDLGEREQLESYKANQLLSIMVQKLFNVPNIYRPIAGMDRKYISASALRFSSKSLLVLILRRHTLLGFFWITIFMVFVDTCLSQSGSTVSYPNILPLFPLPSTPFQTQKERMMHLVDAHISMPTSVDGTYLPTYLGTQVPNYVGKV